MKTTTKICPICQIAFTVPTCHKNRYITCSYSCGGKYRHKPPIKNTCNFCKKIFISKKFKRLKQKYCSRKCSSASNKSGAEIKCHECKKKFYCPKNQFKRKKYCSKKCQLDFWNKKSINDQMPGSYRVNAWKIYEKKCYDCGIKDERIIVIHHIDGNRKNGKINNLIPVCHNCHCIRHIELSGNKKLPSYRGN